MLSIKALGPCCDNCKKVEALAKKTVASLGIEAIAIGVRSTIGDVALAVALAREAASKYNQL